MGLCFSKECCCPHYKDVPISSSPSESPEYHPIPVVSQKYPPESAPSQTPAPAPAPAPAPPSSFMPTPRTSSTFMSSNTQIGPILGKPYVDIQTIYDLDKELGRGQFGITYLCTDKSTGVKYACKSISRRKLSSPKDIEDVRREVTILQYLSGQPNIVEFKGAYEDKNNLHLVMELCCGGELFDRITAKGNYSEKEAARIGRQIVNVVHVCHFMGVMHRDLKPENFLMVCKDDNSPLKATDFGLSVFIEQGKIYKDIVGSAYYVAPEVLKRNYGKEIDVWSAGVILPLCTYSFWILVSFIVWLVLVCVSCGNISFSPLTLDKLGEVLTVVYVSSFWPWESSTSTSFAQPSGISLSRDLKEAYIADSESSSIRAVDLRTGGSRLLAGGDPIIAENLFRFGDHDGIGSEVLLQHPLGVLCGKDGQIYIADSYNHKIKKLDPDSKRVTTLAGVGQAGFKDGTVLAAQFSEPSGIVEAENGRLYIADTNNSVIRYLDLNKSEAEVLTLELKGVQPPLKSRSLKRLRRRSGANTQTVVVNGGSSNEGTLNIRISVPEGYHFSKEAQSKFSIDFDPDNAAEVDFLEGNLSPEGSAVVHFRRSSTSSSTGRVYCKVYYCKEDEVCLYQSLNFEVPFQEVNPDSAPAMITLPFDVKPKTPPTTLQIHILLNHDK